MSIFVLSAFADEIDMDLQTQMDVLDSHGIKAIEMRGVNGKGLIEYSVAEAQEIKKQLDDRGFRLSSVGSPIGKYDINADFAPHLELFKHTLEIAKVMEAPFIRMFSFWIPKGEDPANHRDEVMNRWRSFVSTAAGYDVTLLHENEKGIYGDTAERCLDLIETMDSPNCKAIFDTANFIQCNEVTYPKAWEMLKQHVVYMHIKDARYSDGHVVPAGHGDGRLKEILAELHKDEYDGFLSLEPHLGNFQGLADLEADSPGADLPEGGPRLFAVAAQELKKLLEEVTN